MDRDTSNMVMIYLARAQNWPSNGVWLLSAIMCFFCFPLLSLPGSLFSPYLPPRPSSHLPIRESRTGRIIAVAAVMEDRTHSTSFPPSNQPCAR